MRGCGLRSRFLGGLKIPRVRSSFSTRGLFDLIFCALVKLEISFFIKYFCNFLYFIVPLAEYTSLWLEWHFLARTSAHILDCASKIQKNLASIHTARAK